MGEFIMPRTKLTTNKTEVTTAKPKKPAATKDKKATEAMGKAKTAKTTPSSIKSNAIKTPKKSEIVLDYRRYGNAGFSSIYEKEVFTITKYEPDGTRQSTRKYSYSKAKNLILDAFGFEIKIDEDGDAAEPEEPESSNVDMKMQTESGNFDDTDNGFDDIE